MKRIVAVAAVLLVGAAWLVVADLSAAEKPSPDIKSPITLSRCRIKLIDQVVLASDRPGILAFVEPEEGDQIKINQKIAALKDEVAKASFEVAKKKAENDIEIRYAQKAFEVAVAEHEKAKDANRKFKDAVTEIEISRLRLAEEKSQLQIEQAENQFVINELTRDQAEAELKTFVIEAPFSGIVTRVYKAKGEAVRQGDPILEVVSTERVRVEGYVEINEVWNVTPGAPVKVRLDIPEVDLDVEKEVFEGRIVFVDVAIQPVTRQARVWAEVVNRNNILRSGLSAQMVIMPRGASTERAADVSGGGQVK